MHKNWWISTGFLDACLYLLEPNLYITSQNGQNDLLTNSDHGSKIAEDLIDVLNKVLQTMDQQFIASSSEHFISPSFSPPTLLISGGPGTSYLQPCGILTIPQ
jgi:hypothetical protein